MLRELAQDMPDLGDLLPRVHEFSMASLKFYQKLPNTTEAQTPGKQFLRSSSAVEANYRAARRGRSRADFTAKLGIVLEEADESVNWLEYMRDGKIASDPGLLSEAKQLCAIFTAAVKTARRNLKRERERENP